MIQRGFLEIVHQGGAFQRDKTLYKYSENWRIWQPGRDFPIKTNDVHRGFQAQGLGAVSTHKIVDHPRTQKCGA